MAESNKQHRENLLNINPVANRANIMKHMSPVMQTASQVKAFGPNGKTPNPGLLAGIAKGAPKMDKNYGPKMGKGEKRY